MIQELVLSLVCYGASDAAGGSSATTYVDGMPVATTHAEERVRRSDVLYLEAQGGTVRVKPPESIIPSLAGRGEDGWRTLTEVQITDREIRGRFQLNWINRPVVVVNRMTGDVSIRGGDSLAGRASFQGSCERVAEQPRF